MPDPGDLLPSRTWDELIRTSRRRGTYLRRRRRVVAAAPVLLVALAVTAVPLTSDRGARSGGLEIATNPSPSATPDPAVSDPTPAPSAKGAAAPAQQGGPAAPAEDAASGRSQSGGVRAPAAAPRPAPRPSARARGSALRHLVVDRATQYEPNQRNVELSLIREDGTEVRQLTTTRTHDEWDPAWSRDGRRIAFAMSEWSGRYGDSVVAGIFVMSADGTSPRRVTTSRCPTVSSGCWDMLPSWSPDGRRIVFERTALSDRTCSVESQCPTIWTVGADGSGERRVTTGWAPDWSPDGRQLVFADTSSGEHANCQTTAGSPNMCKSFLYVSKPDGTGRRALGPLGTAPKWSPDGRRIVFMGGEELGYDLAVLEVATGAVKVVTNHASSEMAPSWSPDGREIVYTYAGDVYLADAEGGSAPIRVTRTPASETVARFAP